MKLSIIWILSNQKEKNKESLENLVKEIPSCKDTVQLLVYGDKTLLPMDGVTLPEKTKIEYREETFDSEAAI